MADLMIYVPGRLEYVIDVRTCKYYGAPNKLRPDKRLRDHLPDIRISGELLQNVDPVQN